MCGILGQFRFESPIDPKLFNRQRDRLRHRGPDGAHSWFSQDGFRALGFRRLSFLDLSAAGMQPMQNEKGNLHLVCNGEIYNYIELKNQLQKKGHTFRSQSDSEVILHGYEEWGTAVLNKLKGMFAFAIWDESSKKLFLARDRFGIKPIYYGWLGDSFFFASELKAIVEDAPQRPPVNFAAIPDFLTYRYIPSPNTIWKNLFKIPPAHFLELSLHNMQTVKSNSYTQAYWDLKFTKLNITPKQAVEEVNALLKQSVHTHLRSDVPIGSFLSGGYDSSALVYYMTQNDYRPNTFAIGFEAWKESEDQYAQLVASHLNVPFYKTMVGGEQLGLLDKLAYHYDEPLGDISIIPTYQVSELASQHNKAVFSGEGADEIFGGYWWQKKIASLSPFDAWKQRWKSRLGAKPDYFVEQYAEAAAMGRYNEQNLAGLLHPDLHPQIPGYSDWFYAQWYDNRLPPLKAFQYMDVKAFMGELVLVKIDRASMANALEVRVPFLDHELFERVYALSPTVMYRSDQTKFLLGENIKGHLPAAILQRSKQGFVGPDLYYMDIGWYTKILERGYLLKQNIIQPKALQQLIVEKKHWELWKLTILEKWWSRWMIT